MSNCDLMPILSNYYNTVSCDNEDIYSEIAKEYNKYNNLFKAIENIKLSPVINYDVTEHMKDYYKKLEGDNNMLMSEEESKEFVSKQLEYIIKENNIEVDKEDDNYIYEYLSTDKKGNLFNGINCTVGKTVASSDEICVSSLNDAKKIQKGSIDNWLASNSTFNRLPINPSILREQTFKIFKVKINKNHIRRLEKDYNDNITFYVTEVEVVEEVQIENKITYKVQNIKQSSDNKNIRFDFRITNETTNRSIDVDFVSDKIDLSQEEIQEKIKERLDIMQTIYDEYEASHGELEL